MRYQVSLWKTEADRQAWKRYEVMEEVHADEPDEAGRLALNLHPDCEYAEVWSDKQGFHGERKR